MENNEKLKQNAQELKKGLELLSRDRKVVLPHNKAFDLVDELQEKVDEIIYRRFCLNKGVYYGLQLF